MQARGKGLPQTYDAAMALYKKCRKKHVGRVLGNYRIAVSNHDRGEDAERPLMGVWYHSTEVVTLYPDGRAEFTMGSWDTVSTRTVISSVLRLYGLSMGTHSTRSDMSCAFFRHEKLASNDARGWDTYPVHTRQRYLCSPGDVHTLKTRKDYGITSEGWEPVYAVITAQTARKLPKSRNTRLQPKVGDAFLDTVTGNAYIWTNDAMHGRQDAVSFAVPYHGEYSGSLVEIHVKKPLYSVVLTGTDLDIMLLAASEDTRIPIDRTKGATYAHKD